MNLLQLPREKPQQIHEPSIRECKGSLPQGYGRSLAPRISDPYASNAHFKLGSLKETILGSTQPQVFSTHVDSFWRDVPQHSSTPKRNQDTQQELPVQNSPPMSEISVHSKTFKIPSSPPGISSFEGILEKDQEPMIMIPPEPLIEILSKRDSQNKLQEDHLIFHQMMMMMMEPVVVLMMEV